MWFGLAGREEDKAAEAEACTMALHDVTHNGPEVTTVYKQQGGFLQHSF